VTLFALHSVVRAGRAADYDSAHESIPADLIDAHRRAGIRDWWIWRSGDDLFHVVDCDDFDAARRQLEGEPANERWQTFIGDYIDRFELGPGGDVCLPLVWRMRDQMGAPES
jgi:L-rhamnose mutarotase